MITIKGVVSELASHWTKNARLDSFEPIDEIEAYLKVPLPADFKYFTQWFSNGGEGDLPGGYLMIFPMEEILDRQRDYGIDSPDPEFLVFGLEGDHIFVFNVNENRSTADYAVSEIAIGCHGQPDHVCQAGKSFADFLAARCHNTTRCQEKLSEAVPGETL